MAVRETADDAELKEAVNATANALVEQRGVGAALYQYDDSDNHSLPCPIRIVLGPGYIDA